MVSGRRPPKGLSTVKVGACRWLSRRGCGLDHSEGDDLALVAVGLLALDGEALVDGCPIEGHAFITADHPGAGLFGGEIFHNILGVPFDTESGRMALGELHLIRALVMGRCDGR